MKILVSAVVSAWIALPAAAALAQAQPDRGPYTQRSADQRATSQPAYDQRSRDQAGSYGQRQGDQTHQNQGSYAQGASYGRHHHRHQVCQVRRHHRVCYWS